MKFQVNQIVRGVKCGVFVVLGFRTLAGEEFAQVKEVNPANLTETKPGEIALPLSALIEF